MAEAEAICQLTFMVYCEAKYIPDYVEYNTMQKIIGTTDLQRNFRAVLDEVVNEHVPYVLTRGSRPEAVLVPYSEYLRYQQLEERDVLWRVDMLLARLAEENAEYSADEVAADVAAAVKEARVADSNR